MSDAIREAFQALDKLAEIADDHPGLFRGVPELRDTIKAGLDDALREYVGANKAALSANGGEAVADSGAINALSSLHRAMDDAYETMKRRHTHPAPPSVAVPEGFCLERGHRRHYARTGEVCSCPKYVRHPHCDRAEMDDTLPIANPWLTAAPQPDHIADAGKVVWAVIDRDNQIAFSVTPDGEYKKEWAVSLCHEHINEAVSDGVEGAANWVVRPLTIGTGTPSVPEEEVKAQALEEFARDCGLLDPGYDDQEYIEIPRWRFKEHIARLRASQQEGNTAGDDGEGV